MITKAKVAVFKAFRGDADGFARSGQAKLSKLAWDERDWQGIEAIARRLRLEASESVSEVFTAETELMMRSACADEETRDAIRALARGGDF